MAQTFRTEGLKATTPRAPAASWLRQDIPKASGTTFVKGAPILLASGLATEWANPSGGDIWAFSLAPAVSGKTTVEAIFATVDVILEANFLGAAAADNVLAAADLGTSRDLLKAANLLGTGVAGWYISDAAADAGVIICEFASQQIPPTTNAAKPVAGDTNARVRAFVIPGVSAWY